MGNSDVRADRPACASGVAPLADTQPVAGEHGGGGGDPDARAQQHRPVPVRY
jgi:hypothetical protein